MVRIEGAPYRSRKMVGFAFDAHLLRFPPCPMLPGVLPGWSGQGVPPGGRR